MFSKTVATLLTNTVGNLVLEFKTHNSLFRNIKIFNLDEKHRTALYTLFKNIQYFFIILGFIFCLLFQGPTSGGVVTLKTGRRQVPGSNPGRACRPSHSEFSLVFSETRLNTS